VLAQPEDWRGSVRLFSKCQIVPRLGGSTCHCAHIERDCDFEILTFSLQPAGSAWDAWPAGWKVVTKVNRGDSTSGARNSRRQDEYIASHFGLLPPADWPAGLDVGSGPRWPTPCPEHGRAESRATESRHLCAMVIFRHDKPVGRCTCIETEHCALPVHLGAASAAAHATSREAFPVGTRRLSYQGPGRILLAAVPAHTPPMMRCWLAALMGAAALINTVDGKWQHLHESQPARGLALPTSAAVPVDALPSPCATATPHPAPRGTAGCPPSGVLQVPGFKSSIMSD
jgi:hypothetical protein